MLKKERFNIQAYSCPSSTRTVHIKGKDVQCLQKLLLYTYIYVQNVQIHALGYYRFRRQHEQLRQVIVRVLRPTTTTKPTQAGTPGQEEADVKVVKPLVDEVADANAIEVREQSL